MLKFILPQSFSLYLTEEFDDLENFSKQRIEKKLTNFNTKMQKYFEKHKDYSAERRLAAFYVDFIFSLNLGKEETYIAGVIALSVIHMNRADQYRYLVKDKQFYQLIKDFHSKKIPKKDFTDKFYNLSRENFGSQNQSWYDFS